ncbi:MAG TPA: hypothetical protein VN621_03795 [Arthrobacter sp.]|nr:hypothetical protein [Arthrobacter sp.]
MPHASPFPPRLAGRLFTLEQARAEGVSASRLHAADVRPIARCLYAHGLDGPPCEAAVVAGLNLLHPTTCASHATAARLLGLYLPRRIAAETDIHLSRHRRLPPLDLRGIVNHRTPITADDVLVLRAPPQAPPGSHLQVIAHERTWLEMAARLTVTDLVVMGDQLLRLPRPGLERRNAPLATRETIAAAIKEHPQTPGIGRVRAAFERMRVGADSPAETRLRLAISAAGLPEPELQVRLDPADRYSPASDLGYRQAKVALQYDGYHHRSPEQLAIDNRRDLAFTQAGWTYLKFDWQDARTGFDRAIVLVRQALGASRGSA